MVWQTCSAVRSPLCRSRVSLLIDRRIAYRQPVLYNLSVTREILKQIYVAESLQPPTSLSTIQNAYKTIWSRASNVAYWRQAAANAELARISVYALEAYGIFKVRRRFLLGRSHFPLTRFSCLDWRNHWATKSRRLQPTLENHRPNCMSQLTQCKSFYSCEPSVLYPSMKKDSIILVAMAMSA